MTTNSDRVPERTCVGCRRRRPQHMLVRCVLGADGSPVVSRTAAGRGAWLCVPPQDCFALAVRRRGFDRAWRRTVPARALEQLADALAEADSGDGAATARRMNETKG